MKDAEKDRVFANWVLSLDKKFLDWSWRRFDSYDDHVVRNNLKGYDWAFRTLPNICHAPGCRYPIREGQERLPVIGDVCNLCYFMFHLVNARAYWIALQKQDDYRSKK